MDATSRVAVGTDRYNRVAQAFHWTVVVLVLVQYVTKLASPGFASLSKGQLNAWHLAIGPTILLLMLLRLVWRLTHRVPPPPQDIAPTLRIVSRATHWLFYAILIVLPVLGWVAASGYGAPVTLLGIVPLPAIAPHDKAMAQTVGSIHGVLAWLLLAIIALHICGALYHLIVKRDGVLRRMLPVGPTGEA